MSAVETIERALQLAASGKHRNVEEIRRTLSREKYEDVERHLAGASIKTQLKSLIEKAQGGV